MSSSGDPVTKEFSRQRRVLDQSIDGYAFLSDRYARRSTFLTIAILALSVAASAFAFASGDPDLTLLGVTAQRATWVGALSSVVFLLGLIELKVDWRERAQSYGQAARVLSDVKAAYRGVHPDADDFAERADDLSARYNATWGHVPPLPQRAFVPLKARHVRKLALSRMVDEHPGVGLLRLRWRLWRDGPPPDQD